MEEEKKGQEVVNGEVIDKSNLPIIMQLDKGLTEDIVKKAEKEVEYVLKLKILAIRVTNYDDWTNQGGKPYLQNSGCMKVAQLFGINFLNPVIVCDTLTDDRGMYKIFTCSGEAEFKGRKVEDIGMCSTRDDFFGSKDGTLIPIENIDITDIKKKAVTNWQNRVLKKILGLNFTWEDLKEAKIDTEKIGKVNYNKGVEVTADEKKLQSEIGKWLIEMFGDGGAAEHLEKLTEFPEKDKDKKPTGKMVKGVKSCNDLKGIRLNIAHGKVKEMYAKFNKEE